MTNPTRTTIELESGNSVVRPTGEHCYTIILLHGRDSTGAEFASEFLESEDEDKATFPTCFPSIKWVFPTAHLIHSERFGIEMSQWFDMHSTEDPRDREDRQDLMPAIERIQSLLRHEAQVAGGFDKVFLGGISQGAAVAIHVLLRQQERLCGFIGLSTWLPKLKSLALMPFPKTGQGLPVFIAHNRNDEVINARYGWEVRGHLSQDSMVVDRETYGMVVNWKEYATGGHWLNEPDGVRDLMDFIRLTMEGKSSIQHHQLQA